VWLSNSQKNQKSVDRVPSKSRPTYTKKLKAKFQTPIYTPNGGRFPQAKTTFVRVARAIRSNGQTAGAGPKPKNASTPNFEPTLLKFREINFHKIFSIVRAPVWLSNAVKKSKICRQSSEQSRLNYAKMPNFKPPYLPQMGADSPPNKNIFLRVARAISC